MDFDIFLQHDFAVDPAPFLDQLDSIADLALCQQQISERLDQVEVDLMNEVSKQSTMFFGTLSVLQDIQDELTGLSSATAQVSTELDGYESRMALEQEELAALYEEQRNIEALQEDLVKIDSIQRLQKKIQELINSCSFDEALFLIEKVEGQINESFKDFGPLSCLKSELSDMKLALGKMKLAALDDE